MPKPVVDKFIESHSNPILTTWMETLLAKGIKKHGFFIVAGDRAVRETLEKAPQLVRNLILCADRHVPRDDSAGLSAGPNSWKALIARARELTAKNDPRFSIVALARPLFDQLDVSGTHSPMLAVKTPEIAEIDLNAAPRGIELMLALGDPANVGAILRSAAAFGVSKVVLLKECASPFHPKAVRAASAATLMTPLAKGPSIKDPPDLAKDGALTGPIIALDMDGKDIRTYSWPTNVRVLIGEEGQGVPPSQKFEYVSIPMRKDVESLNATIAASIALFSAIKK